MADTKRATKKDKLKRIQETGTDQDDGHLRKSSEIPVRNRYKLLRKWRRGYMQQLKSQQWIRRKIL